MRVDAGSWTDELRSTRALLDRFVRDGEVGGAAVAVAVGGEQVFEYSSGHAAPGQPATAETLWPLASISKTYTAATIMALAERGALTLEFPVSRILPTFTGDGREHVTLRHLLTHTSGLVYESPEMNQRLADRVSMDALLDEAYEYPLLFAPGTRLHYSDYGFALLGRVASTVAGRPFPELVHQLVIDPAGLRDTYFPPPPNLYGRVAHVAETQAYGTEGAMYNTPHAIDLAHPAFGVVASVSDLLRFGLLLGPGEGGGVLSRASVRRMKTDQNPGHVSGSPYDEESPAPFPWGMGLFITGNGAFGPDLASPQTFGHDGGSGCTLWVDPVQEVAVAYVSNRHYLPDPPWFFRRLVAVGNTVLAGVTRTDASNEAR